MSVAALAAAEAEVEAPPEAAEHPTIADVQASPAEVPGPITREYQADPQEVIRRLNQLRSTEIISSLQYKTHAYMAVSLVSPGVKEEFLEHAEQELEHAEKLARRIQQLNGVPIFDPSDIESKAAEAIIPAGARWKTYEEASVVTERRWRDGRKRRLAHPPPQMHADECHSGEEGWYHSSSSPSAFVCG